MDMSYHGFARILYTSSPIGHNTHIRYMNHIVPTSDTAATWSIEVARELFEPPDGFLAVRVIWLYSLSKGEWSHWMASIHQNHSHMTRMSKKPLNAPYGFCATRVMLPGQAADARPLDPDAVQAGKRHGLLPFERADKWQGADTEPVFLSTTSSIGLATRLSLVRAPLRAALPRSCPPRKTESENVHEKVPSNPPAITQAGVEGKSISSGPAKKRVHIEVEAPRSGVEPETESCLNIGVNTKVEHFQRSLEMVEKTAPTSTSALNLESNQRPTWDYMNVSPWSSTSFGRDGDV
ncbi:hypothetical protein FB45DRAFT_871387 [Roridomyces roridus]|uniref:Uncharacterized protein n=1 Tax=Roridomyces roridus TaxID=1738132 RepID=A0AAD7FF77_9AGAR|nr:hypothetical protein FB45DRAFT_871387 [Roridomyces roridus]